MSQSTPSFQLKRLHKDKDAVARALDKVTSENRTRDELLAGKKLGEVYATYGVL